MRPKPPSSPTSGTPRRWARPSIATPKRQRSLSLALVRPAGGRSNVGTPPSHRRRRDPLRYVPEHALAPIKASIFLPYIFSHDEVRRVLIAARSHDGRFIWASMLHRLRLGEAVRLRTSDVDAPRFI